MYQGLALIKRVPSFLKLKDMLGVGLGDIFNQFHIYSAMVYEMAEGKKKRRFIKVLDLLCCR